MANYRSKKKFLILMCIYKGLLDFLYINYISVDFKFYKFLDSFSLIIYIVSWIVYFFLTTILYKGIKKAGYSFSSIMVLVLFLLSCVPFTSMMYCGYDYKYLICNFIFWTSFLLFYYLISPKISKRHVRSDHNSLNIFALIIFYISALIIVVISAKYTRFRLSFNIDNAYVFRTEAEQIKLPVILSYLYQWARIIVPIGLCYFIFKKQYMIAVLFFFVQMLNYGIDGMRLTLLITIISVAIPILYRLKVLKTKSIFFTIPILLIISLLLSVLEHLVFKTGKIENVITFRVLFLPNLIQSWFFDFFSINSPDFFKSGFLRYFGFESQYSHYGIDYLISGLYFGDYSCRANTGLLGDAMANLGYFGTVLLPLFICLWLRIVDDFSYKVCTPIVTTSAIYFSYCFTNNFFTIILFTNGGFILVILFYIISLSRQRNCIRLESNYERC